MLRKPAQHIASTIIDEISSLLALNGSGGKQISPGDELNGHLGLTSLELAQLIAALETRLEADPFAEQIPITSIRTVRDLIGAYEQFLSADTEGDDVISSDALFRAQDRAISRRRK